MTSNVKNYVSIEFITRKKPQQMVLYDAYASGRFWSLDDLYNMTLTFMQLRMFIFQLGTPEYHNLDTKTTKLTRIRPYLYCQWPFWVYAN